MRTSKKLSNLSNIICFTGSIGSGKTLAAVAYLASTKPQKLYSNIPLKIPSKYLSFQKMLALPVGKLRDSTMFIDMVDMYLDSRLSSSRSSLFFTHLLAQSRHLSLKIVLTCQSVQNLDKRVRRMLTTEVRTHMSLGNTNVNLAILDYKTGTKTSFSIKATPYFNLYDTKFIIPNLTFGIISVSASQQKLAKVLVKLGVEPGSKEWNKLMKEFKKP